LRIDEKEIDAFESHEIQCIACRRTRSG
jgi:hypothetical protein